MQEAPQRAETLTPAQRLLQQQAAQLAAGPCPAAAPSGRGSGSDGGCATVFVRGLPAAATEAELRSVMAKFGPLKACR